MDILMLLLVLAFFLGIIGILVFFFFEIAFIGIIFGLIILGIYLLVKGFGIIFGAAGKVAAALLFLLKWAAIVIAALVVIAIVIGIVSYLYNKIASTNEDGDSVQKTDKE